MVKNMKTGKIISLSGALLLIMYLYSCGSKNNVIREEKGQDVLTEQRKLIVENILDAEKKTRLLTIVNDIESEAHSFFSFYFCMHALKFS